jgi:hypothetical protein
LPCEPGLAGGRRKLAIEGGIERFGLNQLVTPAYAFGVFPLYFRRP